MKLTLAIICGGMSGEHQVSLLSAKSVLAALDRSRFDPVIIGVDKMGVWRHYQEENWLDFSQDPKKISLSSFGQDLPITPQPGVLQKLGIDAVFPLIHGSFGEDGTLQGLLEFMEIPYVGPDVAGSAIAIDKDLTKRILNQAGIPVVPSVTLEAKFQNSIAVDDIWKKLGPTCFVKPARCGSSLGISKVTEKQKLVPAIYAAFEYDDKILIEKGITGRELECAVLDGTPPVASVIGEIVPPDAFYSYEAKYIDDSAKLLAPTELNANTARQIQDTALKAFSILGLEGMARVDFFLENTGTLYINELNTIPGFTKISMYPKLLSCTGIPYAELITRLIELGIKRYERKKRLKRS